MKKYIFSSMIVLFILIIWQIIAFIIDIRFIFPTPVDIVIKIWQLRDVLIFKHLPTTLIIICLGMIIALIFGVGLGIVMKFSPILKEALYPILVMSQTIPVIAIAPIFILWFGYSIWGKVAMTVLLTFFPITINTIDGLEATDKRMEEFMLTLGARKVDIFWKVNVPYALPYFFSGLKVATPLSVIGAVIGEWLGAQSGLGYFSKRMMTQFDGSAVFAPIVLLSVLGVMLFVVVVLIEKKLLKWR